MGRLVLENLAKTQAREIDRTDDWIWCRVLGSFDMYAMNGDKSLTPHLVQDGYWESWISQWLIDNLQPNDTFIDIGANAGYYAFLARHLGAAVAAFEPQARFANMMKATIDRNGWRGVRVNSLALSDKRGTKTLNVPQWLLGSSSFNVIPEGFKPREIEVVTRPLDDFFHMVSNARRYIIKMDVEGHEESVWHGMTKWLKYVKPTILLEYTPGAYSDKFLDHLQAYAPLAWINHNGEAERVDRDWIESQTDWVMLLLQP